MNVEQGHHLAELRQIVNKQICLLTEFARLEGTLPDIVKTLVWTEVEERIYCIQQKAEEIESVELEIERHIAKLKSQHALPENSSVYDLAGVFPAETAANNEKMLTRRKCAFARVKDATQRLRDYFGTLSKTLSSVLGELIPEMRGNVYSKDGKTRTTLENVRIVDSTM